MTTLPSCVASFFNEATASEKLVVALQRMAEAERAGAIAEEQYKEVIDLLRQGDNAHPQAVSFLRAAVRAYPENTAFADQLVDSLDRSDELHAAEERYRDVRARRLHDDPVCVATSVAMANAHNRREHYGQAAAILECALEENPAHPEILFRLGLTARLRGDSDTAADGFLQRALDEAGKSPQRFQSVITYAGMMLAARQSLKHEPAAA